MNTEHEKQPKMMTIQQVAEFLAVDDTTVRRWIKAGAIEAVILPSLPGAKRQSYRIHYDILRTLVKPES